jgi:hypothetical protein
MKRRVQSGCEILSACKKLQLNGRVVENDPLKPLRFLVYDILFEAPCCLLLLGVL